MRTSLYGAVVLLIATVGILIGCAGKEQSMTMATPPSAAQATPAHTCKVRRDEINQTLVLRFFIAVSLMNLRFWET